MGWYEDTKKLILQHKKDMPKIKPSRKFTGTVEEMDDFVASAKKTTKNQPPKYININISSDLGEHSLTIARVLANAFSAAGIEADVKTNNTEFKPLQEALVKVKEGKYVVNITASGLDRYGYTMPTWEKAEADGIPVDDVPMPAQDSMPAPAHVPRYVTTGSRYTPKFYPLQASGYISAYDDLVSKVQDATTKVEQIESINGIMPPAGSVEITKSATSDGFPTVVYKNLSKEIRYSG